MTKKSKNFIEERNNISYQLKQYWDIIYAENVVNKNYMRKYDLKVLFEEIKMLAEKRALIKLKLLAINMGLKKLSDLPKDCNQLDIFRLCELKEIRNKISSNSFRTLNPVLKAKKGKKNLNRTEIFTSNWKFAHIKKLDLQIIELNNKLEKFNNETEFDDTIAPLSLAA